MKRPVRQHTQAHLEQEIQRRARDFLIAARNPEPTTTDTCRP